MRRLLHVAWVGVEGLVLLTTLLVVLFWARSQLWGDSLVWRRAPRQLDVLSYDGVIVCGSGPIIWPSSAFSPPEGWRGSFWPFHGPRGSVSMVPSLWEGTWGGFKFSRFSYLTTTARMEGFSLCVPFYAAAAVLGAASVWIVGRERRAWRRRKWRRAGRCVNCGYDLRASPEKCPECGHAPPAAAAKGSPTPGPRRPQPA